MFKIIGLLVALLSCLTTLTWAQGNAAAPAGVSTPAPAVTVPPAKDPAGRKGTATVLAGSVPAGATNKSFFESRSSVASEAAAKRTFNESRPNAATDTAAKKTFNESRSNALRTGEAAAPAGK